MAEGNTTTEEPSFDRRSADIGIVCTQHAEIRPLLSKLDRLRKYVDDGAVFRGGFLDESIRLAIIEAGPGFAKHREVTKTLIQEHHPAWVLSVGFSSPLTDDITSGDICLANEICDVHGNSLPVKCSIPESKRIFVRKHVAADQHPRLRGERVALSESASAAAVDTTSLAVAQACAGDEDKPLARFLSIRAIVGGFDNDLSDKAVGFVFGAGEKKQKVGLLGKLTQKIKPDPELSPWQNRADEAAVNLNRFLLGVIRQLAEKLGKY